ncbi:MAG: G1 family glutamic endopeptidase [Streptosporangiaceae bacterium]
MRRSWPIIVVTLSLVFGAGLAFSGSAADAATGSGLAGGPVVGALSGMVQPGGPVSRTTTSMTGALASSTSPSVIPSANWAGYVATGAAGGYTGVSSSWTEPTGQCGQGDQYSAFWVGLDGLSDSTVEQTGSEVDCSGSTAKYSAWYEMYPAAPVYFTNPVKPGDALSGSVTYENNAFQITLADSTQGWTQTVSQSLATAERSSAEVVAEAPCCTAGGGVLPLTDFGSASFTSVTVNGAGLCDADPEEITMPGASVTPVSSCQDFGVSYGGGPSGGTLSS